MLYMFAATDPTGSVSGPCAQKGQAYLRRAMRELYKPGPAMFCGDEDNGEFGAWLVLSALGPSRCCSDHFFTLHCHSYGPGSHSC